MIDTEMRSCDGQEEHRDQGYPDVPNGHLQGVPGRLALRGRQRQRDFARGVLHDERQDGEGDRSQEPDDDPAPEQRHEGVDHRQRENEERVVGVEDRVDRTKGLPVLPEQHVLPVTGQAGSAGDPGDQGDTGAHPGDDPPPGPIQIASRQPPANNARPHEPGHDGEADEEQHDLGHERGPEDVRVAE